MRANASKIVEENATTYGHLHLSESCADPSILRALDRKVNTQLVKGGVLDLTTGRSANFEQICTGVSGGGSIARQLRNCQATFDQTTLVQAKARRKCPSTKLSCLPGPGC